MRRSPPITTTSFTTLLQLIIVSSWFILVTCEVPKIGETCQKPDECPFTTECVRDVRDDGNKKDICICRLEYMLENGSFKENYTKCTPDYSPFGFSSFLSKNNKLESPALELERIPDNAMEVPATDYRPWFGRLHESEGKGGWCGDGTEGRLLWVYLGGLSTVSMIATQGVRRKGYTMQYRVQYGVPNGEPKDENGLYKVDYKYVKDDKNTIQKFDANTDESGVVYNFIEPVKAMFFRIEPLEWKDKLGKGKQCLRHVILYLYRYEKYLKSV